MHVHKEATSEKYTFHGQENCMIIIANEHGFSSVDCLRGPEGDFELRERRSIIKDYLYNHQT